MYQSQMCKKKGQLRMGVDPWIWQDKRHLMPLTGFALQTSVGEALIREDWRMKGKKREMVTNKSEQKTGTGKGCEIERGICLFLLPKLLFIF